ncbi:MULTISPECIES: SDR family NAD(P)-dependent oxidoreductase [Sphingobium]|jgi:3-oxoacyl-[acyl-carrier protein] reductase|uniref:Beta-ketoacyl-ACP reductase n=1 Tax=Sphingobium fuliginis (strain ATCC 27551) TaxID=336203 RepID=A0A4Q4IXS1_SPHSA|nr:MULTISPECIES: SDR family oxidoreductase [Sphingobium]MCB4862715.1 SDR family oxidoreductase [Sphingobium sp. PNB]QOT74155.1 SDR family oxidoreductase [Sphingobium fuliginis]RYL98160.1 SDR family oxidoreductase [Sphingobium fuliginis]WDA34872.1 SDR family oxidoreductase [Sphingobium sp. YC-XJ3]GFZ91500.1 beta-ketoacyl-ACP reductase [Sphingobium fuliginis]
MGLIEGQVAIVTGAANEVTRGIALRFAREGAKVVLVDKDDEAAQAAARPIPGAEARSADLSDPEAARALADAVVGAHGRIDIMLNGAHAALKWDRLADRQGAPDFTAAFNDVLLSAINMMQAVYPHMKAAGGGRIVNLGSIYGPTANEGVTDAVTMDFALTGLTRSAGVEWGKDGILVNFLQPAVPDIAIFADYRAKKGKSVDTLIANMAMPRLADPVEDVGGAAMFLVSDEACFILGHRALADGGQHLTAAVFEPGAQR